MCGPALAAMPAIAGVAASTYVPLAIGAGASYIGAQRSAAAADSAQAAQMRQKNGMISNQTLANQRQSDAALAANAAQMQIDRERMGTFNEGLDQLSSENTQKDLDANTKKETGKLEGALKDSVARGEQQAKSGVKGNTSKSFSEAEGKAVEKSGQKASSMAKNLGIIGGAKGLNENNIHKLGNMNASLAAYGPKARGQSTLDQMKMRMAGQTAPEMIQVVDPNSTSGNLLSALGGGLMSYGLGGAFGGNTTQGLLGPSGTANPYGPGSGMAASNSVWGK